MAGEVELMPPQRKKKTDVSVAEAAPERPMSPWEMLSYAIKNNFPADQLKTFTELYREWRHDEAENEYNKAIARAAREFPVIAKRNRASFGVGKTAYVYEDLGEIQRAIKEPLSKNGLHYFWDTDEDEATGRVMVTCIVSHDGGHSRRNRLSEKRDTSGSKSSVQALGSIVTYLQRYTLKAALGLPPRPTPMRTYRPSRRKPSPRSRPARSTSCSRRSTAMRSRTSSSATTRSKASQSCRQAPSRRSSNGWRNTVTQDLIQGSPEWLQARLGKLTASRFHQAVARTKTGWGARAQPT